MPRALGDTFASGELKADRMADIMDAADILEAAIAFDENPPFEAKYLLAYWEHRAGILGRSEEHTSELQSLMRISYAVFCLKNKNTLSTLYHFELEPTPIQHTSPLTPHSPITAHTV